MAAPEPTEQTLTEVAERTGHLLGNALGAVKMALQGLERHAGLAGRDAVRLEIALNETTAMERMLGDLAMLAAEPVATLRDVDVNELIERAIALAGRRRRVARPAEWTSPPGQGTVHADPDMAAEALARLIENGLDAGNQPVRISIVHTGDGIDLCVDDDGDGLPPGDTEPLFAPFHGHRPRRLGLGLAIAQRLAHAMGGEVQLSARAPGTRAVLLLPAREATS